MSILEAQQMGLPVVARRIAALADMPAAATASRPQDLARLAAEVLTDASAADANRARWREVLDGNTRAEQRERLLTAYARAMGWPRSGVPA